MGTPRRQQPDLLTSFYPRLKDALNSRSSNQSTIRAYENSLYRFATFATRRKLRRATQVDRPFAAKYFKSLIHQLHTTTAQLHTVALRGVFQFYEDQGVVKRNPFTRDLSVSRNPSPGALLLNPGEVHLILDSIDLSRFIDIRNHAILSTVYYTCSRIESVLLLRRKDYDVPAIHLRGIDIPVHPDLNISLNRYLEAAEPEIKPTEYLFQKVKKNGQLAKVRVDKKIMKLVLARYTQDVGLNGGITTDVLRDSATATFLNNGGGIRMMMSILGARSLRWLERFVMLQEDKAPTMADILKIE
jgi:site-specific recombinase XerD